MLSSSSARFASSATAGTAAGAGSIPVIINNSTISTEVSGTDEQNPTKLSAGDSVDICSDVDSKNFTAGGAVGVASTAGIGITANTVVFTNKILTTVGDHVVIISNGREQAPGAKRPNRQERRHGVNISATGHEDIGTFAVAGGVAGAAGVAGVVNTLDVNNEVKAIVTQSVKITAKEYKTPSTTKKHLVEANEDGDVHIEASDAGLLMDGAGALSVGSTAGIGATIVTLIYEKDIKADVKATIVADGDVTVKADSNDELYLLALTFGAGGTAAVSAGANALIFQNKVEAVLGSVQKAYNVEVTADSDETIYNIAAGIAVAGAAGISVVAVVTYFENEVKAHIYDNSVIGNDQDKITGNVKVTANTVEFITSDAGGVAGGEFGIGGIVDVIVTSFLTQA